MFGVTVRPGRGGLNVNTIFSKQASLTRLTARKDVGSIGVSVAVGPYMKKWMRVALNVPSVG